MKKLSKYERETIVNFNEGNLRPVFIRLMRI